MDNGKAPSKFLPIESYLQTLFHGCSIQTKKLTYTNNYLVRIDGPSGRLKHHLIFFFEFIHENTSDEVIERLKDWCLKDVLEKTGENVVFISNDGIHGTS
jgi:hypothetical protein